MNLSLSKIEFFIVQILKHDKALKIANQGPSHPHMSSDGS